MKSLLFHAIPPEAHQSQRDWENFLRDAALEPLPADAEQLARNVWLIPDDGRTYLVLSPIGHRNAIATRVLRVAHGSEWQRLSSPP